MPVKSAFELAWSATVPARRRTRLHGRSWSGEGAIKRVEVSTDGGATWRRARLHQQQPAARLGRSGTSTGRRRRPAPTSCSPARPTAPGRTQPDTVPFNTNGYLFWAVVRHPVIAVGGA